MTLLPRIRSAGGADRELDAALYWRFDDVSSGVVFSNGSMGLPRPQDHTKPIPGGLGRLAVIGAAPRYTSSLDAAIALVERVRPGCGWDVERLKHDQSFAASVFVDGTNRPDIVEHWFMQAATPALALLAALLASLGDKNG